MHSVINGEIHYAARYTELQDTKWFVNLLDCSVQLRNSRKHVHGETHRTVQ